MAKMISRIAAAAVLTVALISSAAHAGKFEVTAVGLYQFGGAVDETTQETGVFTYRDALGISGSGGFGFIINYHLGARTVLEASWDRQSSSLNYHVYDSTTGTRPVVGLADLSVQYYMLGLVYDWSTTGNRPFIGGSAGIARLAPSGGLSTETHPAFAFIGGYKMAVSNKILLRGHVRLAFTKMPEGSLFTEEYQHHKETFMPQFQVGIGIGTPL